MIKTEVFSSRWGLIVTSLGMAIGAGNLWRFPRLAGEYGGTFILLWTGFLFIWSIPILLSEFAIGKAYRRGVIGSYATLVGKNYTWMGFFIALCSLGITFYYSVVVAWSLRYLGLSLYYAFKKESLSLALAREPNLLVDYWESISSGNTITILMYVLVIGLMILVLSRGIQGGFEKANKVFIPLLFLLLIIIGSVAIHTGKGVEGITYMFKIDLSLLRSPRVLLEALSQSAWSTGAGWGLMMTIGAYSRKKEDVSLNIFISGLGNNIASLLAGMAILPSVFALSASRSSAIEHLSKGNQALMFNVIPELFTKMEGGIYLSILFFGAFFLAAFSSLLSLWEMFIKIISDLGFSRKKALFFAALCCMLLGLPSAYSLSFFENQDWVWGIGLILSGLFIVFSVLKYGITRFKKRFIDPDSDFVVYRSYFSISMVLNLILGIILIWWWMSQGYSTHPWFDKRGYWNIMDKYSNATIISQWILVIVVGILLNSLLYKVFTRKNK